MNSILDELAVRSGGRLQGEEETGKGRHTPLWVQPKYRRLSNVHCQRCGILVGRAGNCESCLAYVRAWKKAHPERVKELSSIKNARITARRRSLKSPEDIEKKNFQARLNKKLRHRVGRSRRRARLRAARGLLTYGIIQHLLVVQGGECAYCPAKLSSGFHLDHIMPLALGGLNADDNVQLLCPPCNQNKGARHPDSFVSLLKQK